MCGGSGASTPQASFTASGNFAGWAVASVIIGVAPRCSSATFTPTAVCGQITSPVVSKVRRIVAMVSVFRRAAGGEVLRAGSRSRPG